MTFPGSALNPALPQRSGRFGRSPDLLGRAPNRLPGNLRPGQGQAALRLASPSLDPAGEPRAETSLPDRGDHAPPPGPCAESRPGPDGPGRQATHPPASAQQDRTCHSRASNPCPRRSPPGTTGHQRTPVDQAIHPDHFDGQRTSKLTMRQAVKPLTPGRSAAGGSCAEDRRGAWLP
jgi:hypothetical protein